MQRPVCWRTRLQGHHRNFELARRTGENLVHWPVRQPPESVRDGVDTRRPVPSPPPRFIRGRSSRVRRRAAIRRAFGLEGDIAYRVGSSSRRVGDSGASFSRAWRRTPLRGGVPAGVLESPRAQLRDPPRDLVSRPRPSFALPRVLPRGPVRAVEFHPVRTAFAPARHRIGRTSTEPNGNSLR